MSQLWTGVREASHGGGEAGGVKEEGLGCRGAKKEKTGAPKRTTTKRGGF